MTEPPLAPATVERCWRDGQAVWEAEVNLSPPQPFRQKASDWRKQEPLAFIDLATRQVVVNFDLLARKGLLGSLTAVLAHEVGHHVRFPHTLGLAASLQVLEKRLVPGLAQSLTNLFFDLQVNEVVGRPRGSGPLAGRDLAAEAAAVYRSFGAEDPSPLFAFYLAVYEELWGASAKGLVPAKTASEMDEKLPGWRADARKFVQTFYALEGAHRQFVYFCSVFIRYVGPPEKLRYLIPLGGDVPVPDLDDFDSILRGYGQDEAEEALREARENGWLEDSGLAEDASAGDALGKLERISSGIPGNARAEFKLALVSRHYKRLVDEHILKLPAETPPPEPFLPGPTEDWEWGDSPAAIDWNASVLARGPLAGVQPLRRELLPDEPSPSEPGLPAVEIYLDTSGSMPDPSTALNAMTLAAQILSASALRKNGRVRAVIYSSGPVKSSPWMYDEETARRFLLQYAGGGTDFPFPLLHKKAEEAPDVLRVIVSDSDFLANVQQPQALEHLSYAVDRSRLLVALLATSGARARSVLERVLGRPRFRLALVGDVSQFGKVAADLADAVLGR